MKTATMISNEEWEKARALRYKDARARLLGDAVVHQVMGDHGRIDPERADEEAHNLALAAVTLLITKIYEDDAELRALRAERDRYKQIAQDAIIISPPRFFITPPKETPDDQA